MAPAAISAVKVGHVDDVQELARNSKSAIPQRFIRDVTERPSLTTSTVLSSYSTIPVLDLSIIFSSDHDQSLLEISKLAASCKDWGFFQVVNHGVDESLLENMEKLAMEFFMLPLEEKQRYSMAPGTVQGYGQAFIFSEDQKLDWCNMFALGLEPKSSRIPALWPNNPEAFSGMIEAYSKEIRKICKKVMEGIALSLGLKTEIFEEIFGYSVQAMRMNYYPPCPKPDEVLGLSPHSDGSGITVLQQGNTVGLQILRDGEWVSVDPIKNALVINIGDTVEVLTNGRYKSVEHRAVTHRDKDRLSIVTFYAPSYESELGPIDELVDDDNPCKFRRYNHGEYSKHYVTNKLQGKKRLEFAMLQKHPLAW
ncbi:hypothetical protein V2J09_015849 [Rumex salicifolius]